MEKPTYFLGLNAHDKHGVILSQIKYALDLLEETILLSCKHGSTPMDTDPNFLS